jgi:hypothetical protein
VIWRQRTSSGKYLDVTLFACTITIRSVLFTYAIRSGAKVLLNRRGLHPEDVGSR